MFAISGGLVAVRKDLDIFGVLVLAGTTGLGGGFLRDVLIGAVPPAALADWRYLLAHFCVTGALKALEYGLGVVPAALLGMLTGLGGGMLRDLLAGRVPVVLRGELYATPALVGAGVAVAGVELGLDPAVVAIPAAALCFGWRLLAMRRGWSAPTPGRGAGS